MRGVARAASQCAVGGQVQRLVGRIDAGQYEALEVHPEDRDEQGRGEVQEEGFTEEERSGIAKEGIAKEVSEEKAAPWPSPCRFTPKCGRGGRGYVG